MELALVDQLLLALGGLLVTGSAHLLVAVRHPRVAAVVAVGVALHVVRVRVALAVRAVFDTHVHSVLGEAVHELCALHRARRRRRGGDLVRG